ncbi:MAG TPA: hypothetical protein VEP71_01915, partial [Gallionella sp.]|nr:hypothetical protein [Gallionella sp.]
PRLNITQSELIYSTSQWFSGFAGFGFQVLYWVFSSACILLSLSSIWCRAWAVNTRSTVFLNYQYYHQGSFGDWHQPFCNLALSMVTFGVAACIAP